MIIALDNSMRISIRVYFYRVCDMLCCTQYACERKNDDVHAFLFIQINLICVCVWTCVFLLHLYSLLLYAFWFWPRMILFAPIIPFYLSLFSAYFKTIFNWIWSSKRILKFNTDRHDDWHRNRNRNRTMQ